MVSPINALFNRNFTKIRNDNFENDYFSSYDSEEDKSNMDSNALEGDIINDN